MITYVYTVGMDQWIIVDSCVVLRLNSRSRETILGTFNALNQSETVNDFTEVLHYFDLWFM